MQPQPIEVTPEEREQERKTDDIVREMDLATEPVAAKRRQWYGIVRADDAGGLAAAVKYLQDEAAVDEVHLDRGGLKALVIQKRGPAIADIDI